MECVYYLALPEAAMAQRLSQQTCSQQALVQLQLVLIRCPSWRQSAEIHVGFYLFCIHYDSWQGKRHHSLSHRLSDASALWTKVSTWNWIQLTDHVNFARPCCLAVAASGRAVGRLNARNVVRRHHRCKQTQHHDGEVEKERVGTVDCVEHLRQHLMRPHLCTTFTRLSTYKIVCLFVSCLTALSGQTGYIVP